MMNAARQAPEPRIAALVIPDFLVDICLRENPSLAGRPLGVADGVSRREIVAANRAARGVQAGMTPKQARAACPGLVVIARDEKAERKATSELLDALENCTPAVEAPRPGVCFFDARGLPGGETAAIGSAVALAMTLGLRASAAVADDKFSALCAALTGGGCSIVPPNASAAFLAPLPVSLLPLAPGDGERFDLLGLRLLGQIAALPTAPLAARFGERAREYACLARGEQRDPLRPRRVQTVYEERFAFESPVDRLEPLFFALRGCIAGIADRLAGAAQVCDRVSILLILDATNCIEQMGMRADPSPAFAGAGVAPVTDVQVALAEPSASAAVIFDLARVALESREQIGSVEAVIVRAAPCGEPPPQLGLFDGSGGSRNAALAATLARLHATLADHEVVTLQTQGRRSRMPERMQRRQPVTSPRQFIRNDAPRSRAGGARAARPVGRALPQMQPQVWAPALRLVDPPRPMQPPAQESARAGPFRLSESWWEQPVERDYYQMTDRNGALVLAFFDIRRGGWYVQGVFD
jgi:nucleotidyltransferase/DNA polymerase involved in DNA repair